MAQEAPVSNVHSASVNRIDELSMASTFSLPDPGVDVVLQDISEIGLGLSLVDPLQMVSSCLGPP
jgi:hypothetical protein